MPIRSAAQTRQRILAEAGPLFALQGLEGLGIRQLARAARVNLAAVNYHFGSKQALFREVCLVHLRAINARRASALASLERRSRAPEPEMVLKAHLEPLVAFARGRDPSNLLFLRVVMAQVARRDPSLERALAAESRPILDRTLALLARSLPGRRAPDLLLGLVQVIGSATHLLMTAPSGRRLPPARLLARLVAHGAGGLRALPA